MCYTFDACFCFSYCSKRFAAVCDSGSCPCHCWGFFGHQWLASARNAAVSNAMFISWAGWMEMFRCGLGFWGGPWFLCIGSLHTWDLHFLLSCNFTLKYLPLLVPKLVFVMVTNVVHWSKYIFFYLRPIQTLLEVKVLKFKVQLNILAYI